MDESDPATVEAWKVEDIAPPLDPSPDWMVSHLASILLIAVIIIVGVFLLRRSMHRYGEGSRVIRKRRMRRIRKLLDLLDHCEEQHEATVYLSVWDEYCLLSGLVDGVLHGNVSVQDQRAVSPSDPLRMEIVFEPDGDESAALRRLQTLNETIRFNRGWANHEVRTQAIRELRLLLEHLSRME